MALLRVDPGLVIWLWITFGIILLILRLTVWGRITGALDKRSQKIASDLDSARERGREGRRGAGRVRPEDPRRQGRGGAHHRGGAHGGLPAEGRASCCRSQEEARELRERAAHEIERPRRTPSARSAARSSPSPSPSRTPSSSGRPAAPDNRAFVEEFADKLDRPAAAAHPAAPRPGTEAGPHDQHRRPQLRAGPVRAGRGDLLPGCGRGRTCARARGRLVRRPRGARLPRQPPHRQVRRRRTSSGRLRGR